MRRFDQPREGPELWRGDITPAEARRSRPSRPEEPDDKGPSPQRQPIDWRGWIVLAWVIWFGLLYGKMVIEQRGGKLRGVVASFGKRSP